MTNNNEVTVDTLTYIIEPLIDPINIKGMKWTLSYNNNFKCLQN